MAELKTKENNASVKDFLNSVSDKSKKEDSLNLLKLFEDITKEKPKMWGTSIIGFGKYYYKSERSKQEGYWPLTGFSPRKQALTVYIMSGLKGYESLLKKLGKHKIGGGSCLYIKKLEDINKKILQEIIADSYKKMSDKYNKS